MDILINLRVAKLNEKKKKIQWIFNAIKYLFDQILENKK